MKILLAFLAWLYMAALLHAQSPPIKTGPEIGTRIPSFTAVDQHGSTTTSQSILGPKGALLVFFRSADW